MPGLFASKHNEPRSLICPRLCNARRVGTQTGQSWCCSQETQWRLTGPGNCRGLSAFLIGFCLSNAGLLFVCLQSLSRWVWLELTPSQGFCPYKERFLDLIFYLIVFLYVNFIQTVRHLQSEECGSMVKNHYEIIYWKQMSPCVLHRAHNLALGWNP